MKKLSLLIAISLFAATAIFAQINTPTINTTINSKNIKKSGAIKMKKDLALGDEYQGGIIIHLWADGQHGIICAKENIGSFIWGKNKVTGAPHIGGEESDSQGIVDQLGNGDYAAKACIDYTANGYSDWFLPSRFHLAKMFKHVYKAGKGNFEGGQYWSVNECYGDQFNFDLAWAVAFGRNLDASKESKKNKTQRAFVRPVRQF